LENIYMRIPLAQHSYEDASKPLSAQECINLYYRPAPPETKSQGALYGTPGLKLFADIGSGRIWGMHEMGGLLYVVAGDNVYTVNSSGGANDLGTVGTVSDVVIMDDNGTHVIITLEEGGGWLADASSLTQITDVDFPSVSSVTVLDTYAIYTKLNTTNYILSALNDATAYDAADISSAEESPDLLVRAFANHGELWLFGERTTEVHINTGTGDFPFVPQQNAAMQRGCAAKRSVAGEDNTLFWLGDDRIVYRADGYTPKGISTRAIETAIQGYTTVSDAESFIYTQNGHKFYVLTFPTELVTWVFDIYAEKWHQRQSFEEGRWRATGHTFIYSKNLVGDFETGKIYELDLDTYTDNGTLIQRVNVLPVVFDNDKRIIFSNLKVDFDSGVGLNTGQGSDPQCMMSYSDDGGMTFGNEHWRTIGAIGVYKARSVWRRLGISRQRVFKLVVTDPVRVVITAAYINESD
jgi:hypothetical protein